MSFSLFSPQYYIKSRMLRTERNVKLAFLLMEFIEFIYIINKTRNYVELIIQSSKESPPFLM